LLILDLNTIDTVLAKRDNLTVAVDIKLNEEEITVRKVIFMLAALLCMSGAVPAFAEMTSAQKDECVLASKNCSNAVDDIQTQIKRIAQEIDRGSTVYTAQELKTLERKLYEVREMLRDMDKR
jgi:uncharacterized protein YlxW (UPF0749 family)